METYMMILGLDISTAVVGLCILDSDGNIVELGHIDLKKCDGLFQKAEVVRDRLENIIDRFHIERVFIEQSLQMFRPGMSSAKTLSTLSAFNGIVSWLCYEKFILIPKYLAATSARKACGIKIPKGVKAKPVVLQHCVDTYFKFAEIQEYTRHGNPKQYLYDIADAIVIAMAGYNVK